MVDDQTFEAVPEALPELEAGQYRVRIADLSIDLTKRGWIREEAGYLPPVQIGEVVESRNEEFPVGAAFMGMLGWREYATWGRDIVARQVPPGVPLPHMMSVFGTTGVTADFGMFAVAGPNPGETVVVSGAASATGSMAARIAKIRGRQVIGIAGTEKKADGSPTSSASTARSTTTPRTGARDLTGGARTASTSSSTSR